MVDLNRLYNPAFYECLDRLTSQSARAIVPRIVEMLLPTSVVDIGCGTGQWARVDASYPSGTSITPWYTMFHPTAP